jgi:hypothetical protein
VWFYSTDSKIISSIPGTGYFIAQVENRIGVFSPIRMLHFYPSLKYDLGINLERISPDDSLLNINKSPTASYRIPTDKAPSLFQDFLEMVDFESDIFPKIFHVLQELQDLKAPSLTSFTNPHVPVKSHESFII